MKKYILFFLCVFLFTCGRWKTSKLKSDILCTINPGDSPGNIMLKYDEDQILNISFKVEISNNNIYIADNILKRLQVINKNCEPVLYIGEKKSTDSEKSGVRFSKFQFSIIEAMVIDSTGNIYVQNSFSATQRQNTQIQGKDIGISPSYILVFDEKGTLLYTLGKTGTPDIPFSSIDSLKIDKKDRLLVITKSYDMWSVFRFTNKRRDFTANFSEADFKSGSDSSNIIKIEKIIAFQSGDEILISVAYYNNTIFSHRKIFTYSVKKEKIANTALTINDPKNEVFTIVDDNYIYLWDVSEKAVKFMINNLKGDTVNNISISFSGTINAFNEILINDAGHFYSYHAVRKGIEVLEWR